jgi:hypothetical protein
LYRGHVERLGEAVAAITVAVVYKSGWAGKPVALGFQSESFDRVAVLAEPLAKLFFWLPVILQDTLKPRFYPYKRHFKALPIAHLRSCFGLVTKYVLPGLLSLGF